MRPHLNHLTLENVKQKYPQLADVQTLPPIQTNVQHIALLA